MLKQVLIVAFLVVGLAGCNIAEKKAVTSALGDYVGIPGADSDPLVDNDGDGDPTNDLDNLADIQAEAARRGIDAYAKGGPYGLAEYAIGGGVAVVLGYLGYKKVKAKKPATSKA